MDLHIGLLLLYQETPFGIRIGPAVALLACLLGSAIVLIVSGLAAVGRVVVLTDSVLELRRVSYAIGPHGLRDTTSIAQSRTFALGDSFGAPDGCGR
jgi:hypothetical protein